MTITKLINELTSLLATHGDIEVTNVIKKNGSAEYIYGECNLAVYDDDNNKVMITGKEE